MPVDLSQAAAALAQDRPAEARPLLESATRTNPRDGLAWALLAQTYLRLKQPANAATAARRAQAAAPGDPKVQHALALYFAQAGERKRAAALETQFARSAEADKAAALRAGMLQMETGGVAAAIEMGELALKQEDRVETRELLARAYEAAGKLDDALTQRREVARLLPYSEEARAETGKLLLRAGRFSEAAAWLEQARTVFDKSPQIELALGVAFYSLRRFDDAAGRFLRVIDLDPEIEQPYVFLARMLDQVPERMPAITERAVAWERTEKNNHYAPFVLAKVKLASGEEPARVRPVLEEAIRRQPKFWESHFELGVLLEQQGQLAEAAAELKTAIALNAKQAAPHYRLARIYDRLGQKQNAARERELHAQLLAAGKQEQTR